ncbi:MAG: cyclic nucleotide-binding domain-containing protein [Rhodospirillales bacterium]
MAFGNITFDVYGMNDGRWSVYSSSKYRETAIEEAKELLGSGQFDAIKVVREDERTGEEETVFSEKIERKGKGLTVIPVEEAPMCETLEDFYQFESRKTAGRVLRKYLDENGLTAFELLHNYGQLRFLCRNNEDFLNKAVHVIARAQAKATGGKHYERVEVIYEVIEKIVARAESFEGDNTYYDLFKKSDINTLLEAVRKDIEEENQGFRARLALSKYLGEMPDWQKKLMLMIEQAENEPSEEALTYLDEIIAEIFDGTQAVQEVFGFQHNRAETIETLAELSAGRYQAKRATVEALKRFSDLKARHPLPNSRHVILDRAQRELGSTRPLTNDGKEADQAAFAQVMEALIAHHALSGDNRISEAATMRAKSLFVEEGQDESWDKAIDDMLRLLENKASQFAYLVDLCSTEFGVRHQGVIIEKLESIIHDLHAITDLVDGKADRRGVIRGAATVRDRLMSTKLPDEWRMKFARTIYNLLMAYQEAEETAPKPSPRKRGNGAGNGTSKGAGNGRSSNVADNILNRTEIEPGAYIFQEGEEGTEAYFVAEGEVEISRTVGNRHVVIAKVGKGSFIGEMALIDTKPRMASAKAVTKTSLMTIPKEELQLRLNKLEEFDPIMRRLVGIFVDRMRNHPVIEL